MSRLDDLIQQLCPNGVEYNKVKNVYKRLRGTSITAAEMKKIATPDGEIKIFAGGKTVINAKAQDISGNNIIRVPAVLVQSRGIIDVVYYEKPFTFKNEMWAYTATERISVRFLFYVLKNNILALRKAASGMGSLPQISLPVTEELLIPVPPLPVQEEIVRILDKFTALEAELEAELEARRKQYEFYRDQLLTFGDEVEWKPLKEIAYYSSERVAASMLTAQNYVGVDNLLPNKKGKTKSAYVPSNGSFIKFRKNDILIGNIRPYLKKIWLATHDGGTNGDVLVICIATENKLRITPDFLYYLLSSDNFFYYDMQYAKGAKMPRGNKQIIMEYHIPVPPLAEQERIVAILDKFDALVNDISSGLPAELEMRRKQYEYYRDRLLTFKPLAKEA